MRIICNAAISNKYPEIREFSVTATTCGGGNGIVRYRRGILCDSNCTHNYHVSHGCDRVYAQIRRLRQVRGTLKYRPLWLGLVWIARGPKTRGISRTRFLHPKRAIAKLREMRKV